MLRAFDLVITVFYGLVLMVALPNCDNGDGPEEDAGADAMDASDGDTSEADVMPQCMDPPRVVPDGEDCQCAEDCLEGAMCMTEEEWGLPSGECIRACELGSDDCSDGSLCEEVEGSEELGLCRTICEINDDCAEDQICGYGRCSSFCTDDGQCRSGFCNSYTGQCHDGSPPEGAGVDGECLRDEDCRSGVCHSEEGRCATLCSTEHDGCPEDAHCVPSDWALLGRCLSRCETSDDCHQHYDCVAIADPLDARVCLQEGTDATCEGRAAVVTEGGPCGCPDDCSLGASCLWEWSGMVPLGMCIRPCMLDDPLLSETGPGDECGSDYVCVFNWEVSSEDGGGACHPLCSAAEDCLPGRICSATLGCFPFCQSDDDCLLGICDEYTGWCGVTHDPEEGAIGVECQRGGVCRSMECREDEAEEHGYCTARCSIMNQRCPDDALCVDDGEGDDMGYCAPRCADDTNCGAAGTVCAPESRPGLGRHCDFP